MPGFPRGGLHLVEFAEARSAELLDVDGRIAADRRHRPRRVEKFAAGLDQVGRAGADLLRVADQHRGAVGQLIGQQRHAVGPQHRQQGLHAVDRDAFGELGQHVADATGDTVFGRGLLSGQGGGSRPYVIGQQHFATGDRDHGVDADFGDRPLVGHREHPHLADLVAPELHPHRVLGGRREDVENASADREFAPATDHVHPGVGQLDQPGDDVFEDHLVTDGQGERFQQTQSRDHRLQQRTDRGDDHLQRRTQPGVVRVGESADHHHSRADRVDTG